MCGGPHRAVVHAQVAAHRAHHHLARVEPHADLHVERLAASQLVGIAGDSLLHAQCRVASADRVVLMRQRRTEQRHDAVAHHLVDRSLVVMHRFHHPLENRIQNLPCLLGIAIREQLHRALQVGEQHRHLLALAFERGLRQENFFGEVLGGEALWSVQRLGSCGLADGVGALGTEFRCRRYRRAATGTRKIKGRGTFLAELRAYAVFVLTAGALHDAAASCAWTQAAYTCWGLGSFARL